MKLGKIIQKMAFNHIIHVEPTYLYIRLVSGSYLKVMVHMQRSVSWRFIETEQKAKE